MRYLCLLLMLVGCGGEAGVSAGGVEYEPRVSEQKYLDFLEGLSPEEQNTITKEQMFAHVGEPTHRDPPLSGVKEGRAFTLEVFYWKKPGSGVESTASFVNGRPAGHVIGMETGSKSE